MFGKQGDLWIFMGKEKLVWGIRSLETESRTLGGRETERQRGNKRDNLQGVEMEAKQSRW